MNRFRFVSNLNPLARTLAGALITASSLSVFCACEEEAPSKSQAEAPTPEAAGARRARWPVSSP